MRTNLLGLLGLVCLCCTAMGQGEAELLWIPLPTGANYCEAIAVSDEGLNEVAIVGMCQFSSSRRLFRWRMTPGLEFIWESGLGYYQRDMGVSADGRVVVGGRESPEGVEAIRWLQATGAVGAGVPSWASCVTANGSTAFGYFLNDGNRIFRWTDNVEPLGLEPMYVQACSADGNWLAVSVPYDGLHFAAARWSPASGTQPVGLLPEGTHSNAYGISDDGCVVVGTGSSGYTNDEAFRWTIQTGIEGLSDIPGAAVSWADGVSGDGAIVIGSWVGGPGAMIQDQSHGIRSLREALLSDYGLDLGSFELDEAFGISRDGRSVVGTGQGPQGAQAWLVRLRPCCSPADINCDRIVDLTDLTVFLAQFGSCSVDSGFLTKADIDRRGCVDLPDLTILLSQFGTTCP